jgi:hypothetical protein
MVPVEYEGSGLIPKEGLFNTVMNWNVRGTYQDGVTLSFKAGSDSTKFIATDGWIMIHREGVDSTLVQDSSRVEIAKREAPL